MDFNEMFKIRPVNGDGNKYMITIGDQLASQETFNSIEEAEEKINATDWNLVAVLAALIAEERITRILNPENKE